MRLPTTLHLLALATALSVAAASHAVPAPSGGPIAPRVQGEAGSPLQQLTTLATQGSTSAQLQLGMMYQTGQGVPPDASEAAKWFAMAAKAGEPAGQTLLIGLCMTSPAAPAAQCGPLVDEIVASAAQGDAQAQIRLGGLYLSGAAGLPRDTTLAVGWFRKAADQGNVRAQFQLGLMYADGQMGVPADFPQALAWLRKAAAQGDVSAMQMLGSGYKDARFGLAKDPVQAAGWYRQAADGGDPSAAMTLAAMYGAGEGVAQDAAQSVSWYRRAAEHGNVNAAAAVATAYAGGKGVPKDDTQAYAWMAVAVAQAMDEPGGPDRYWVLFMDTVGKRLTHAQQSDAQAQAHDLLARLAGRDPAQDAKLQSAFGF